MFDSCRSSTDSLLNRQFREDIRKLLPILVMWKLLPLSIYWLPFVLVTYPAYLPSTFKLGSKVLY